jgi:hypothetical protein
MVVVIHLQETLKIQENSTVIILVVILVWIMMYLMLLIEWHC